MRNLPEPVREAVERFVTSARDAGGDKVRSITLYGSYARGDASKDSDVDLLMLWDGGEAEAYRLLVPLAADLFLETGVDISVHPVSLVHRERMRSLGTAFHHHVEEEGVPVFG